MIERVLEPEVMDTIEEAEDYDRMDHAEVNRRFVDDFLGFCETCSLRPGRETSGHSTPQEGNRSSWLLDVGTGTGQIPMELVERNGGWSVLGIDLAQSMLTLGRTNIERAGLCDRIHLQQVDAKEMPYADQSFAGVISNSIVHHIPKPMDLFRELRRVLAPGGVLFVRDLLRPATIDELDSLVALYTGGATPSQRQLFRQSLYAALTLDEVRQLAQEIRLTPETVQQTSDRHWTLTAMV